MERVQEHASEMSSRADESDARVAALEVRSLLSLLSFTSGDEFVGLVEMSSRADESDARVAAAEARSLLAFSSTLLALLALLDEFARG